MCRKMRCFVGWILVLLVGVGGFSVASAQRLLVVSQARNAVGEASRLVLHNVDLDLGTVEPGPLLLSGTELAAPLLLDRQQFGLFVSSSEPWSLYRPDASATPAALTVFHVAPLSPWQDTELTPAPDGREWPIEVGEDQQTLSNVLVTARFQVDTYDRWRGALATRPWPPEGLPRRVQIDGKVLPLPVVPCYVLPTGPLDYVVLGATGSEAPVTLLHVQLEEARLSAPETFPATEPARRLSELRGALLDRERGVVWILFSALTLGDGGMRPASWLYAIDQQSLTPTGPPLEIPGIGVREDQPLALDPQGRCWVATREPGTDFGHVTRAGLAPESRLPVEELHTALVGVKTRVQVIPDFQSDDVLVTYDRHFAHWPEGLRSGAMFTAERAIAGAWWTSRGVIITEGNHIHRLLPPDWVPDVTVALQTGWPLDLAVIPEGALPRPDADADGVVDADELKQQSNPFSADTDDDGIPDGRDPHPNAPSPNLVVAPEVVFPYAAVGRQLRALPIESPGDSEARWRIEFDSEALPWLRIHPRISRGSGYAYMGVDPERFDPAGVVSGEITVTLQGNRKGNRPGYTAAGSPAKVRVRVAPPRDPLPTVLWLWPESTTPGEGDGAFSGLRHVLANAPYYVSHVSRYGPVSEVLEPYSIIVLGARAAAEGVLTQKALFDYLNDGGALLFHGAPLEGEHYRDLSEWLRPLDVNVDMSTRISGRFSAENPAGLLRHWGDFDMSDGCVISDLRPRPTTVQVAGRTPGEVVFSARTLGPGRVALLGAPTPLTQPAISNAKNRAFALDLFYWLSRAGYDISDRDGDGLLDSIEDTNENGVVDVDGAMGGESNWLDPDSDNDGIPDGLEDVNRNGVVDSGETDPRLADTDRDGVNDGADASPAG